MISKVSDIISAIQKDLDKWGTGVKPWFRGESDDDPNLYLCPKIASFEFNKENYLLQSFRRQAGGFANVPDRGHTDEWLFLAQHYGVPTRLLDWTEGALHALYFAINREKEKANPRVYMLNPRKLNEFAGVGTYDLNYPLSWARTPSALYVALAWGNRNLENIKENMKRELIKQSHYFNFSDDQINAELKEIDRFSLKIPIAFPATYRDQRMIAQRSCFTIHGEDLKPLEVILRNHKIKISECLFEYKINIKERNTILKQLNVLGISAATIFPDLDHLATDLKFDVENL